VNSPLTEFRLSAETAFGQKAWDIEPLARSETRRPLAAIALAMAAPIRRPSSMLAPDILGIDPDHAGLDLMGHTHAPAEIIGPDIGRANRFLGIDPIDCLLDVVDQLRDL
jgi:hypothetical protein